MQYIWEQTKQIRSHPIFSQLIARGCQEPAILCQATSSPFWDTSSRNSHDQPARSVRCSLGSSWDNLLRWLLFYLHDPRDASTSWRCAQRHLRRCFSNPLLPIQRQHCPASSHKPSHHRFENSKTRLTSEIHPASVPSSVSEEHEAHAAAS